MPYKIELEKFVKILTENKIGSRLIKKILEDLGIDREKINELTKDIKESDEEEYSGLAALEKDVLSLSFDLANLKANLNSLKSKVDFIERKLAEVENKTNSLYSIINENLPFLLKKVDEK
ncbi:MAG: hypothetical protein RXR31_00055 [Thermoproteota archaeon]|jgi:hypothetical protein